MTPFYSNLFVSNSNLSSFLSKSYKSKAVQISQKLPQSQSRDDTNPGWYDSHIIVFVLIVGQLGDLDKLWVNYTTPFWSYSQQIFISPKMSFMSLWPWPRAAVDFHRTFCCTAVSYFYGYGEAIVADSDAWVLETLSAVVWCIHRLDFLPPNPGLIVKSWSLILSRCSDLVPQALVISGLLLWIGLLNRQIIMWAIINHPPSPWGF